MCCGQITARIRDRTKIKSSRPSLGSHVLRIEDARESLLRSHWDLIIVDEAHKMSAASRDKTTLAYDLGAELSKMTDHYLLMTATPHKGDPTVHTCGMGQGQRE